MVVVSFVSPLRLFAIPVEARWDFVVSLGLLDILVVVVVFYVEAQTRMMLRLRTGSVITFLLLHSLADMKGAVGRLVFDTAAAVSVTSTPFSSVGLLAVQDFCSAVVVSVCAVAQISFGGAVEVESVDVPEDGVGGFD